MTILLAVIARSGATKQSRSPTLWVGECVGEANLGSQTQRFANCVGEANLGSQTQRFANCVGEANLIESATPSAGSQFRRMGQSAS
jgi:hypothetical protein